MWRNVAKCGEVLGTLAKQCDRLALSVNSQQETSESICAHFANCSSCEMWRNIEADGEEWEARAK